VQLSFLPWDFILIFLALGVIVPWRGAVRVRELLRRPDLQAVDRIAIYATTIAFQWIAAGLTAWRCYARGWTAGQLGISSARPAFQLYVGVSIALALGAVQFVSIRRVREIPPHRRGRLNEITQRLLPRTAFEALPFVALVCTVSVCEEFLYRGFAFGVLYALFNQSVVAAMILSSALFGIGHLYQGVRGATAASILGLILAAVRVWTGSIAPATIIHLAVDLMAGLYGSQALFRRNLQTALSHTDSDA
jgi:uncharacterized protein